MWFIVLCHWFDISVLTNSVVNKPFVFVFVFVFHWVHLIRKTFIPRDVHAIFDTLVSVRGCARASIQGTAHGPIDLVREEVVYVMSSMSKKLCDFYFIEITII